ncbi:T9SS type A sorting domain-containing protein [Flammeovirga aprica]|uniref:T9SS type A sorting domain-containing protein n=1 Tax=Flammeovirga aprica JL-4 TaxID=694437 RepID=A0A7X9XCU2_9BACT|nr:T9SS type A sorting domain-containing protein [Flammeovirga aprica]NME72085.1 T9SS type A sorting domain-containing protein [Flammeovirga aprica JL-4]
MKKYYLLLLLFLSFWHSHAGTITAIQSSQSVFSGTPFEVILEVELNVEETWSDNSKLIGEVNGSTFELSWQKVDEKVEGNQKTFWVKTVVFAEKEIGNVLYTFSFGSSEKKSKEISIEENVLLEDARLSVGYQGWFGSPNDGVIERWNHWFLNNKNQDHPTLDLWPLVNEEDYPDREKTDLVANDGSEMYLYSNAHQSTADTHVQWISDYGINAFFVGRFMEPLSNNEKFKAFRNTVMQNMLDANSNTNYNKRKVKIGIFYNLTTSNNSDADDPKDYLEEMWEDWKDVVDNKNWIQNENYLHKEGKPVLRIYGMGFVNRPSGMTAEETLNAMRRFNDPSHPEYQEKYAAYLIGGVPSKWNKGIGDAFGGEEWQEVYESFDMIQPWLVNRYQTKEKITEWVNEILIPDMIRLNKLKGEGKSIGYLPLIFPGFSWFNLHGKYNGTPREGGTFFWAQAYEFLQAGVQNLMIANFDEVDEGTAIFKCVNKEELLPAVDQFTEEKKFLHLNSENWENVTYPTDWYLRLSGEIAKMIVDEGNRQEIIPIDPASDFIPDGGLPTQDVFLINDLSNLNIKAEKTASETRVQLSLPKATDENLLRWKFQQVEENTYLIVNTFHNQCLWAPNGSDRYLRLKEKETEDGNCRWIINEESPTTFSIQNAVTGRYIAMVAAIDGAYLTEGGTAIKDKTIWKYRSEMTIEKEDDIISSLDPLLTLKVYPNPACSTVFLSHVSDYFLFDINGKLRCKGKGKSIDISVLEKGLYILKVNNKPYKILKN